MNTRDKHMKEDIIKKLEELQKLIEKDDTYKQAKAIQKKLLENSELINQIERLKKENIHSNNYLQEKKKLYENEDYKKYQELENKLYIMTLEINQILNRLIEKRSCQK